MGFVALSAIVLGSLLFGLVTLNALVAQGAFRVQDLDRRIDGLSDQHDRLRKEYAVRGAPLRLAKWARKNGLRLPQEIYFVTVPAEEPR